MRRQLLLVSLVPAVLMVGGANSVASAEGPGQLHTTTTQAAATELFDFNSGACTHTDPTTGRCAIPFYGADLFSGDLAGTQQNAGGLSIDATVTGYAMSVATYSGTVKGCPGPGTAVFRYVFKMGDPSPGTNTGTVDVVPGSGTGGLATLRGEGDVVSHFSTNGVGSTATLNFSCNKGHSGD